MSKSSNLRLMSEQVLVAAAGTRVRLKTGPDYEVEVYSVTIKALSTNTGKVYIDDETCVGTKSFDIDPRDSFDFWSDKARIDLSDIYIDAAVSGEGVRIIYARD